uniref:Uncharacterized protein n=1 Tax=viral metagenome TaxID=1070528 RepID=A0A6C0IWC3_9ZZZZ
MSTKSAKKHVIPIKTKRPPSVKITSINPIKPFIPDPERELFREKCLRNITTTKKKHKQLY